MAIVNWVDEPSVPVESFVIDGVAAEGIGADLRDAVAGGWQPQVFAANKGKCFEGPSPKAKGFLISAEEARDLLGNDAADYEQVVRRYLTAADVADDPHQEPSRWVIDFGLIPLEEAMKFPKALDVARQRVKPERELNRRKAYRDNWWLFAEPRRGMRAAIGGLSRYAVAPRHSKRLMVAWTGDQVLSSDATNVFAFEDDFSMAVLQSRAHVAWAWQQSSTLETRLRYTPTSVFETFPWPDGATEDQREHAADVCRRLLARRSARCVEHQIGLTKLYNAMDDGAYTDLKSLHRALDEAITDCYGWSRAVAQNDTELVKLLTELNRQITEGERPYDPFSPGGTPEQ